MACGSLLAAVAVAGGAFHAHGLESYLRSRDVDPVDAMARWQNFDLAVRYQMLHAVALVLCGLMGLHRNGILVVVAGLAFLAGVALFSGGLYAQSLLGAAPPMVTPIGGVAFMVGWLLAAVAALRLRSVPPGR
jgi:uncharacterized membrane protein YgdD (TMEM256/DUF423 family)